MGYVVDVVIERRKFALQLSEMRTWLDHAKLQATGFRRIPGANACRVGFASEQDARAFAQAFAGQLRDRAPA